LTPWTTSLPLNVTFIWAVLGVFVLVWKPSSRLCVKALPVMFAVIVAVPSPRSSSPSAPLTAELSANVEPVTVRPSVPLSFSQRALSSDDTLIVELVIELEPITLS
jgi:hypothetical protein